MPKLKDSPVAPRGETSKVKGKLATIALEMAKGDHGAAYGRYVQAHYQATGSLNAKCNAGDLMRYYWFQLHPPTEAIATAMAFLQTNRDVANRMTALVDLAPDQLRELAGRMQIAVTGGRFRIIDTLAQALQTVRDSASEQNGSSV